MRLQQLAQLESTSTSAALQRKNHQTGSAYHAPTPAAVPATPVPITAATKAAHDPVSSIELSEDEKNEIIVKYLN